MRLAYAEIQAARTGRRSPGSLILVSKTKDGYVYDAPTFGMGGPPIRKTAAHPAAGAAIGAATGALAGGLAARRGQKWERTIDGLAHATGSLSEETRRKRQKSRRLRTVASVAAGAGLGAGAGHGIQLLAPHLRSGGKLYEKHLRPHVDAARGEVKRNINDVVAEATSSIPKGFEEGTAEAANTVSKRVHTRLKNLAGRARDAALHEPEWQPKFLKGKSLFKRNR
jgi:hypothetical protein